MRKNLLYLFAALLCSACGGKKDALTVTVSNPLNLVREAEMIEFSMSEIAEALQLADTAQIVVLDDKGNQLDYQITYDDLLIFPATVAANASATYTIQPGVPGEVSVKVCGRVYPERMDDIAWENDLVGFRAYGPALQAKGERGFGYDLFTKRDTDVPVLEEMYALECDPKNWEKYRELLKKDAEEAEKWKKAISYHVDHGYGMDCYAVGPTLGAGVAALMDGEEIIYPWCYRECEVLDNGPLRFTARLTFTPMTVRGDSTVVETRLISLDRGQHLNRTVVSYSNLKETLPITAGVVMHDTIGSVRACAEEGYLAYEDPTTGPNQGKIFVGCAFPTTIDSAREVRFAEADRKNHGNAYGHVQAFTHYEPGSDFVYYWGFGWDRADMKDFATWDAYMKQSAEKLRRPLEVKID